MARIPLGNFGYQTAQPAQQTRQMPSGAFGAADGLDALADSASRISAQASAEEKQRQRELEAEAKAAAKEAARVKSMGAQASAINALAELDDELITGLNEGRYDKTTLAGVHAERANKVIEESVKGVAPEHQELVRASLLDNVGTSSRNMRKAIHAKDKADIGAGIVSYMESMQRFASRGEDQRTEAMQNVEAFLQAAGPKAGMDGKAITKAVQDFKEGVTLTWLDKAISQNQGNAKALARIQKDIAEDKFPELDPQKRNFLEAKIQRNQQHLMQKADIAERRNMANLGIMEKRLAWYVENGRDIPATELAQFEKASKGTVFEGSAQMIVGEQKAVAELMRLSPAQMAAKIKEVEAGYGKTPSREQIIHLDKLKRFAGNTVKLLNDSPLDYAVARDGAQIAPLDLTKPDTWASNLAARTSILKEQSQRTGAAPKGLFPQEAQAISSLLRDARPDQQREILAGLSKGFKDMGVFRATMQQIAPDNPVVANAGIFAARGLESTKDRQVADLILRGQSLLRQDTKTDGKPSGSKLIPMPKEEDMTRAFANYEGEAYAGKEQARSTAFQTAKAIYAARSSEEGDYSGQLVSSRWQAAMKLATGNIETYRGRSIVMPYGLDLGTFKDGMKSKAAELVKSGRLDKDLTMNHLTGLPLENAGDGRYFFRVGDGFLVGKDGRPVIVDFNEGSP